MGYRKFRTAGVDAFFINDATETESGLMSAADKTTLDDIVGTTSAIVNVLDYGALTTNTGAVNTPLFQAALDAANAAGKPMFIPPGTWQCGQLNDLTSTRTEIYGTGKTVIATTASTWINFAPPTGKTGGVIIHNLNFEPLSGNAAMQPLIWLHGTATGGIISVDIYELTFTGTGSTRAAPKFFDCIRMDAVFNGSVRDIWGGSLYGSRGMVFEANGFNSGNFHFDSWCLSNSAADIVISGAGAAISNLLNTCLLSNIKCHRTGVTGGGQDDAVYQTITLTAAVNPGDTTITVSPADATAVQANLTAHNPQWVVLSDVSLFDGVYLITAANTGTGVLTIASAARYAISSGTIQGVGTFGVVLGHNARGIQINSAHGESIGCQLYACGAQQVQNYNCEFGLNLKRGNVAINGAQDIKCIFAAYTNAATAMTIFEIVAQGSNLKCELVEPAGSGAGAGPTAFFVDGQTSVNSLNNFYTPVTGVFVPRIVTLNPLDAVAANRPKANTQGEIVQYATDNLLYLCTGFFSNPTWAQVSSSVGIQYSFQHIAGAGSTPACNISASSILGTGATTTLVGTDLAGVISFTSGTGTTALVGGTKTSVCTVLFATSFGIAPRAIIVTPVNDAAMALMLGATGIGFFADQPSTVTNGWFLRVISPGANTITASTLYKFSYVVLV